jgi:ABC-2 type transport system permease protein
MSALASIARAPARAGWAARQAANARAAQAILRRDWTVFVSYRTHLISQLGGSLFTLAMMRFVSKLIHVKQFPTSTAYFGYVVVGVTILHVLTSTLSTPAASIRQELVAGTFERMLLSPIGPIIGVLSTLIFPLAMAIGMGTATLAIAALGFGMPLHWATAGLALPVALLGAMAFVPFGITIAAITVAFKQAPQATSFIIAAVSLLAGFYFPISYLPHWIRWTANVQPFTPAVELMRHLLIGTPLTHPAWLDLAIITGFATALLPLSIATLSAAIQWGRRRGTITEY